MIFPFKLKSNKIFSCLYLVALAILTVNCNSIPQSTQTIRVLPGAYQVEIWKPLLTNKRVALLANQSALINDTHLLDTLVAVGVNVVKIFGPEHGFRGEAPDGAKVDNEVDPKTGIPIISLYGARRRLTPEDLEDVDALVFDLQDVGTRFYTFSIDLHFAMQTAAESGTLFVVMDRPNPHGAEVDGPILDTAFRSGIGQNKIPLLHGLTLGEMAHMINGEGWLKNGIQCRLEVIPIRNYDHQTAYSLPIKPSPNLPNDHSIGWYPTLALFEGTKISVGRGTDFPFQVYGSPDSIMGTFTFTPRSIENVSTNPPHLGQQCFGVDLRSVSPPQGVDLSYLLDSYAKYPDKENFFRSYFNLLAGTDKLMQQVIDGLTEEEIKATWQADLSVYKQKRKQYLLYPDLDNE